MSKHSNIIVTALRRLPKAELDSVINRALTIDEQKLSTIEWGSIANIRKRINRYEFIKYRVVKTDPEAGLWQVQRHPVTNGAVSTNQIDTTLLFWPTTKIGIVGENGKCYTLEGILEDNSMWKEFKLSHKY